MRVVFSILFTNSYNQQIPSPFHMGNLITVRREHREERLLLHNPEHSPVHPTPVAVATEQPGCLD